MQPHPYPLFNAHPALKQVPTAALLSGPTEVQPLHPEHRIYLKRDDLTAADYGGNKIRKLDFLLADAKARGIRELVAFGYAGSNFVAATAWHGHKLGLHTNGYLLPQVKASYIADNLSVSMAAGADLHLVPSTARIVLGAGGHSLKCLLTQGRWPYWIPPGGSSPVGVLGFINAAYELRAQIQAGELPEPDLIYVAFSSMGTVAGLALGLQMAGLKTRIVAIQVVDREMATRAKLARLVEQTRKRYQALDPAFSVSTCDAAMARVSIRNEFFGTVYAEPTAATQAAIARFQQTSTARADTAYSGKALAGLYHDLDGGTLRGKSVLFWHTFNAHGMPPGVTHPAPGAIPQPFRRYF